jgi:hypothetical protein
MSHAQHSPRTAALYCTEEMPETAVNLYCTEEMPDSFVILQRGRLIVFRNPRRGRPVLAEAPSVVSRIYAPVAQQEPVQRAWDPFACLNDTSDDAVVPCCLSSGMDLEELDITGLEQADLRSALG